MFKKCLRIGLAMSLFGVMVVSAARADEWDKRTRITFSQPVEVAGHVLPAGTYVFQLADSIADRHIVQIFSADGRTIIATVLTIPDYRLTATDETVMKFTEAPAGSPQAIRAWFYPGNTAGQEFVYPKQRALQLAKASSTVVPALAIDVTEPGALKTAPIVAVTPDATEMPVADAIRTTPNPESANPYATANAAHHGDRMPKTASWLPLIALFGLTSILFAVVALRLGRRSPVPVVM
jgi:hypothetical protein